VVGGLGEGVVGDADDALTGIAVHGAKGVELLQKHALEAGFLRQFAPGGVIKRLLDADEAAGQCPLVPVLASGRLARSYRGPFSTSIPLFHPNLIP
jgi:hypothetical protein